MRIVVTGSKGQVGGELLKALSPDSEVIGLDRQDLDLAQPLVIRRVLRDLRPNLIINAAAYTAVDRAEIEPDLAKAVNTDAVAVIGEVAYRLGAAVVHFSTDYVFGGLAHSPYPPEAAPNPQSVYGRTKLEGERALLATGASSLILRTGWVYGLRGRNFLLAIVRHGVAKGELKVVSDQTGSPTPARMIAEMTSQIVARATSNIDSSTHFGGREGVYHLTAGGSTTWFGFAQAIFSLLPVERQPVITPIPTSEYPTKATRPPYSVLDCSSTDRAFGLVRPRWDEALAELLRGVRLETLLAE